MHKHTLTKSLTRILMVTSLIGSLASGFLFTDRTVQAAIFTEQEKALISKLQGNYEALDKTPYSSQNIYEIKPSLVDPFNPGKLPNTYITSQVAYINYYRSLFDLGGISSNQSDNDAAQITAAVMAATNASPFVDQHGMNSVTKPDFVSDEDWMTARQVSASSNLNFNVYNESAGDVITDFVTDSYNLTGADTGHRAWILSTRASQTGIGAAYGTNGYRYSIQTVMYGNDIFRQASKNAVTYPSSGVFPIELLQGENIAWSVYLSDQKVDGTPVITIKDLDTGQSITASNVGNYSKDNYGNFQTIITYYPTGLPMISGHAYQVNIPGIMQYNFKLFNQVAANQPAYEEETPTPVIPPTPTEVLVNKLLLKAEKLRDSLNADRQLNSTIFGRSYQDGNKYINMGRTQWYHDFFQYSNPDIQAGIVNVNYKTFDRRIYNSPYEIKQTPTFGRVLPQNSYAYGQKIQNDKYTWYYLGPNQWIKQLTIKDAK